MTLDVFLAVYQVDRTKLRTLLSWPDPGFVDWRDEAEEMVVARLVFTGVTVPEELARVTLGDVVRRMGYSTVRGWMLSVYEGPHTTNEAIANAIDVRDAILDERWSRVLGIGWDADGRVPA